MTIRKILGYYNEYGEIDYQNESMVMKIPYDGKRSSRNVTLKLNRQMAEGLVELLNEYIKDEEGLKRQ